MMMSASTNKSKRTHSNEDRKRSPAKRQNRNENEKRRRDLFSQLISSLEESLNIDKTAPGNEQTNKSSSPNLKLDKASILHQTAEYLKKHQNSLRFGTSVSPAKKSTGDEKALNQTEEILHFSWKPPDDLLTTEEWIQIAIESMNCFLLVAKPDPHNGQIVYVSSNISSLLDYSQNELLNRSLFELILSRDHDQLRDYLLKDHRVLQKCHLSWRRATADEYEQCTVLGAFRQVKRKRETEENYLMSIVKVNTLDRTLVINHRHLNKQFTSRLNLQGKFIYIDSKAREYLGYSSYELIGHTHFDFVHPDDLPIIVRAHQIWKENGSGRSDSYRFLSKGQQWIFLQTECQVQINSWTGKPESYLCTSSTLQNPTESIQKQIPSSSSSSLSTITATTLSSHLPNLSMESRSQLDSMLGDNVPTTDSQITTFLSHLADENYRRSIREKLSHRKLSKQAEIRVREDEINVIEDIIQFIDEFQPEQATRPTEPVSNPMIRSPIVLPMEDYSPHYSPAIPRQNLSRGEVLADTMLSSTYSPSEQHLNEPISSPITPFSNLSRPSPRTPSQFPLSPSPSSPFFQLRSPSNTNPPVNTHDVNQSIPSQPPPSADSSLSSSSSSSSINANSNVEKASKKSSFNRSLPHSLVS